MLTTFTFNTYCITLIQCDFFVFWKLIDKVMPASLLGCAEPTLQKVLIY